MSLSTKKLEPTPGDMIRNPKLVFEKVFLNIKPGLLFTRLILMAKTLEAASSKQDK